jgi:hypothetical protein
LIHWLAWVYFTLKQSNNTCMCFKLLNCGHHKVLVGDLRFLPSLSNVVGVELKPYVHLLKSLLYCRWLSAVFFLVSLVFCRHGQVFTKVYTEILGSLRFPSFFVEFPFKFMQLWQSQTPLVIPWTEALALCLKSIWSWVPSEINLGLTVVLTFQKLDAL